LTDDVAIRHEHAGTGAAPVEVPTLAGSID
jgi:hypothetical protein